LRKRTEKIILVTRISQHCCFEEEISPGKEGLITSEEQEKINKKEE